MSQNIQMQYLNSSGQYEKMVPHTIASDNSCFLSTETAGLYGLDGNATPDDALKRIRYTKTPNRNLITNYGFYKPVNSNGQTSYTGTNIMCFDKWQLLANSTITLNDWYYSSLSYPEGAVGGFALAQGIEHGLLYKNKQLTLSCLVSEMTGTTPYMAVYWNAETYAGSYQNLVEGYNSMTFTLPVEANFVTVVLGTHNIGSAFSFKLHTMKLEQGTQQTLWKKEVDGSNILWDIADRTEQLALCSNYNPTTGVFLNTTFAPANLSGTGDLVAGNTPLATGQLYFVYE